MQARVEIGMEIERKGGRGREGKEAAMWERLEEARCELCDAADGVLRVPFRRDAKGVATQMHLRAHEARSLLDERAVVDEEAAAAAEEDEEEEEEEPAAEEDADPVAACPRPSCCCMSMSSCSSSRCDSGTNLAF